MRCLLLLFVCGCAAVEATPKEGPSLPRDVMDAIIRQADNQTAILAKLDAIESKTQEIQSAVESQKAVPEEKPAIEVKVKDPGVPLYVSTIPGCLPCQKLKDELEAGKFEGFDVQFVDDPNVNLYPRIRYDDPDRPGNSAWMTGYNSQTIGFLKSRLLKGDSDAVGQSPQTGSRQSSSRVAVPVVQRRTSRNRGFLGLFGSSNCASGTCR